MDKMMAFELVMFMFTRDEPHSSVMFHVWYGSARPGTLPRDETTPQLMEIIPHMQKNVYSVGCGARIP